MNEELYRELWLCGSFIMNKLKRNQIILRHFDKMTQTVTLCASLAVGIASNQK